MVDAAPVLQATAAAPPTISEISFVIPAWRVLFVDELQFVDELLGVVGGRLHRDHPGALLGSHVLGDRLVYQRLDVARHQLVDHALRSGSYR